MLNAWNSIMSNAWAISAVMNIVLALAAVALVVMVTQGAGFKCRSALTRLVQRLGLIFTAGALMNSALASIQTHQPPSSAEFLVQIGFMWIIASSAVRHFWSPPIPEGASWKAPMRVFSYVEHHHHHDIV